MRSPARYLIALVLVTAGCTRSSFFHSGPAPRELAGIWVDEVTTPTDTIARVLLPNGDFRTLHVRVRNDKQGVAVVSREERHYAQWYLSGSLTDTLHREFCFKKRSRNGGSCMRFQLDTLSDGRRQMRMLGYPSEQHPQVRVLVERVPR